jgi:hypothetical protein
LWIQPQGAQVLHRPPEIYYAPDLTMLSDPKARRVVAEKCHHHLDFSQHLEVPLLEIAIQGTWKDKALVKIVIMQPLWKVIKNVIKIYNYYENRESHLILSLPRWGVEDETGQTTCSNTSDGDSSDPSE